MVLNEKLTKSLKSRELKLRGSRQNQINTLHCMNQNDKHKKVYTLDDFGRETPTQKGAAHAISKIRRKFQNRIPRELDQNIDIFRISIIH